MRRGFAFLALTLAGVILACTDLKSAEEAPPSSDAGSGAVDAQDAQPDVDIGAPPNDFACDEPWAQKPKTKPECEPRTMVEIDEGAPDMQDISIARSPAGRVAIAFHAPYFIDEGELRFLHFVPDTPTHGVEKIVVPGGTGAQPGYHVKLGASAPDNIHVLAHNVDQSVNGDLVHFRLVDGKKPFTGNADLVVAALPRVSEIAMAVEQSTGNVLATARVTTGTKPDGGEIAKLAARRKLAGGAFTSLPDLATDLSPNDAPGVGAASLLFDSAGTPNVLFHHCESIFGSSPRYHTYDGTLWAPKKTLDNLGTNQGFTGYGVRLAVAEGKKVAVYFHRRAGQSNPVTADLRIATWSLADDTPNIEILSQGIASDDLLDPLYRVAMAVDPWGLIHMAVIAPTPDAQSLNGTLDYFRQVRVDGGGTKWIRDVVDTNTLVGDQRALVDIVVDEKGRPHIAYRSGKTLKVYYVTRYDR